MLSDYLGNVNKPIYLNIFAIFCQLHQNSIIVTIVLMSV